LIVRFRKINGWNFSTVVLDLAIPVVVTTLIVACRDAKDDKFLEAAVAGTADAIVSGEADLLTLHPFRGISILSPTAFLAAVAPPLP